MISVNENKVRESISLFSGNINSAFILVCDLGDSLDFDLDFNFSSSNSLQRFTNVVRNMIQKNIIEKPGKSGRTLILNDRSVLQLLVGRKYLSAGCSMNGLDGYLVGMPTEELYNRLFAKQLPDIDRITRRNLSSSESPDDAQIIPIEIDKKLEKQFPLYHYVKVKPDFYLHVKAGKYTENEIREMVSLLTQYLEDKAESVPY